MNKYLSFILISLVSLCPLITVAQNLTSRQSEASDPSDRVYGLDPLLYNGKAYTSFWPQGTIGTPFFTDADFSEGSLTLRGITYRNLRINYDMYSQGLILKYLNLSQAFSLLEVSTAWLDEFNLQGCLFKPLAVRDTVKEICQVLGTGKLCIAYQWRKRLVPDNNYGSHGYRFTPPEKDMFLLIKNIPKKYKNNRGFIKLFEPAAQAVVRKYLRQHKIRVKKATDPVITELINYCNTL